MPVSYCSGCKRTFSSTSAFDLHRIGNFTHKHRRCLVPQEMSARGMMRNEKEQWTLPPTEEIAPWYTPSGKPAGVSHPKVAVHRDLTSVNNH